MLEERLSSAYSQHSLGYGVPPPRQYSNIYPSMPAPPPASASDGKTGVENFYYGQPAAEATPPSAMLHGQSQWERDGPDSSSRTMTPGVYPPSTQQVSWNGNAYPPPINSPPPSNSVHSAYPGQAAPAQYYTASTLPGQDYNARSESEMPYQTSPMAQHRDSQYQYAQSGGPPPAPVPSAPEQPPSADPMRTSGYQQYS